MLPVATVPSAVGTLQGPPQVSWDVLEVANVPSGVGTVTRELGRAGVVSVPSGDGTLQGPSHVSCGVPSGLGTCWKLRPSQVKLGYYRDRPM